MNKMKIRKSMMKRVKITGTGKILRRHQLATGHLKRNKSKSALVRQSKTIEYFKGEARKIRKVIGL